MHASFILALLVASVLLYSCPRHTVGANLVDEEYEDYLEHLMMHDNQRFGDEAHHVDTPEEQDMYQLLDPDHSLLVASEHGRVDKIKEALARGAHMGTRNNFGVSPLIFAANNGHMEAVRYLLDIGAEIEAISNNGRTPLMWATYWGHVDVAHYLISRGANVDATDFEGVTPLMGAVKHGNMDLIKLLLDQGADAAVVNDHGGSAFTIARAKGLKDIEALLRPHHKEPEHLNPYRIAVDLLYRALVRAIHRAHHLVRKWTGLAPAELNTEL